MLKEVAGRGHPAVPGIQRGFHKDSPVGVEEAPSSVLALPRCLSPVFRGVGIIIAGCQTSKDEATFARCFGRNKNSFPRRSCLMLLTALG